MKKKEFVIVIFLIFFILVSNSYAEVTNLYGDDFNYCGDNYETRAWEFTTTSANFTEYPIINVNHGTCAFGINSTVLGLSCSFNALTLNQETATPLTSGIVSISFNLDSYNQTMCGVENDYFTVYAHNSSTAGSTSTLYPLLYLSFYPSSVNITRQFKTTEKIRMCNFPLNRPYYIDVLWEIDIDKKTTSLLILNKSNGEMLIQCYEQNFYNFSTQDNGLTIINKFALGGTPETGRILEWFVDDFYIDIENVSTLSSNLPVNSYCEDNSECTTNYCVGNMCLAKPYNIDCSSSVECLSGSCIHGKCTQPDVQLTLSTFWERIGFKSLASKVLLGIAICIILSGAIAIWTKNIIATLAAFLITLIGVVLLGLVPWWILIILIIICGLAYFSFFTNKG